MNAILISIIVGTSINVAVWAVLTIIAVLRKSEHEMFLINGSLASASIVLVAAVVYIIYNLILISI